MGSNRPREPDLRYLHGLVTHRRWRRIWKTTGLEAEYQGNDIEVISTDPLLGRLQLMAEQDEVVEVMLDRATAEQLLSALVQFLAHGEGDDATSFSAAQ